MKIHGIIEKLKEEVPVFGGRVAGTAQYSAELEAVRLPLPCAYVYRAGGVASEAATLGATVQILEQTFGVIIAVDNSLDGRGQAAAETLDDVLDEVIEALLGWLPDDEHNAFEFVRDEHLEINRGRLWHLALFRTSNPISSLD